MAVGPFDCGFASCRWGGLATWWSGGAWARCRARRASAGRNVCEAMTNLDEAVRPLDAVTRPLGGLEEHPSARASGAMAATPDRP